ncbi:MAG TPA: hypothetical protein VFL82_06380 [Thermomicrobiales bacterium]|nr:hypothetical protein [Thermomicrobiales bacterium]
MREPAMTGDVPVACLLGNADLARREAEIAAGIFADVRSVEELGDGYALEFPAEMSVAERLTEFIGFERRCCPFFTFEMVFHPANGPIWLRLRGPDGAKSVIEEMMPAKTQRALKKERA